MEILSSGMWLKEATYVVTLDMGQSAGVHHDYEWNLKFSYM